MKKLETVHCNACDSTVTITRKVPNHALHLILSVVTAGIWLIVYLLVVLECSAARSDKCPKCKRKLSGEKTLSEEFASDWAKIKKVHNEAWEKQKAKRAR